MFINTASMYLGILDFLIEWLTTFLTWLIQWAIDILVAVFAEMFYSIGAMLMRFADLVQLMFKRLAGLGNYWVMGENGTTVEKTGDILLDLITNQSVLQVFLALSLIAVVMVIAGSIIQIVRTEYTTEGSRNSKAGVMGQALKSLMMFFIVPLTCVFGVYISSFLLKAIDTATNVTGSSTISGQIFVAAASEANKAKIGDGAGAALGFGGGNQVDYEAGWKWAEKNKDAIKKATGIDIYTNSESGGTNTERAARLSILIDKAYAQSGGGSVGGAANPGLDSWSVKYLNIVDVHTCYNMRSINFIVLWFGGGLAFYMLLMAAFGMIMRLFKATVLFIIVPPVVGLMPLDGGSAFKQWRTKFIGSVIGAYGTIVSLNLLFLIIPILNNVYIFPNEYWYSAQNNFVHLLFTLVAMFMLKDSAKLISDIIGAEDAMGSGEGMAKKVGSAVATTAMAVGTGGAAIMAGGAKIGGSIASKVNMGKANKATSLADKQKYLIKANSAKGGGAFGKKMSSVAGKNPLLAKGNKMLSDFTGIDASKSIAGAKKAHEDKFKDLDDNAQKRIDSGDATKADLKYVNKGYRRQNTVESKTKSEYATGVKNKSSAQIIENAGLTNLPNEAAQRTNNTAAAGNFDTNLTNFKTAVATNDIGKMQLSMDGMKAAAENIEVNGEKLEFVGDQLIKLQAIMEKAQGRGLSKTDRAEVAGTSDMRTRVDDYHNREKANIDTGVTEYNNAITISNNMKIDAETNGTEVTVDKLERAFATSSGVSNKIASKVLEKIKSSISQNKEDTQNKALLNAIKDLKAEVKKSGKK